MKKGKQRPEKREKEEGGSGYAPEVSDFFFSPSSQRRLRNFRSFFPLSLVLALLFNRSMDGSIIRSMDSKKAVIKSIRSDANPALARLSLHSRRPEAFRGDSSKRRESKKRHRESSERSSERRKKGH